METCSYALFPTRCLFIFFFSLEPLPFADGVFDFVRMANISLHIPHSRWTKVLEEVYRVLRPAGVLEIIDDELLWPYLWSLPTSPVRPTFPYEDDVDTEDDEYTTRNPDRTRSTKRKILTSHNMGLSAYEEYDSNVALSRSMEEMFEKMMWFKYGVHPRPHQFIPDLITDIFDGELDEDNVNQPRVFKVALPPSGLGIQEKDSKGDKAVFGSIFTMEQKKHSVEIVLEPSIPASIPEMISSKAAKRLLGSSVPTRLGEKRDIGGLLLYSEKAAANHGPRHSGRFVPMNPSQLEMLICKNLHVLLCCKQYLKEYVIEVQGRHNAMTEVEISSAFWAYEWYLLFLSRLLYVSLIQSVHSFRRTRFNLPHTLNELNMKERASSRFTRRSTDSHDSGYLSSHSRDSGSSKMMFMDTGSQVSRDHTCVRVIRVFQGKKAGERPRRYL
jgi:Methyltransferase domain